MFPRRVDKRNITELHTDPKLVSQTTHPGLTFKTLNAEISSTNRTSEPKKEKYNRSKVHSNFQRFNKKNIERFSSSLKHAALERKSENTQNITFSLVNNSISEGKNKVKEKKLKESYLKPNLTAIKNSMSTFLEFRNHTVKQNHFISIKSTIPKSNKYFGNISQSLDNKDQFDSSIQEQLSALGSKRHKKNTEAWTFKKSPLNKYCEGVYKYTSFRSTRMHRKATTRCNEVSRCHDTFYRVFHAFTKIWSFFSVVHWSFVIVIRWDVDRRFSQWQIDPAGVWRLVLRTWQSKQTQFCWLSLSL